MKYIWYVENTCIYFLLFFSNPIGYPSIVNDGHMLSSFFKVNMCLAQMLSFGALVAFATLMGEDESKAEQQTVG